MVRKYGKPIDLKAINRDIDGIKKLISESKESADKLNLCDKNLRHACAACGSDERKLFLTVYKKYKYFECMNCGALTLEKFPDVRSMYTSDETVNCNIYINESTYEKRVNTIAKPKADFIINVVNNFGNTVKRWIDIGCGGGEMLQYLKLEYTSIKGTGLESDEAEYKWAQKIGLDVRQKFIDIDNEDEEITKLLQDADIVSFFNVLEHIEKPKAYIDYLYRVMKKEAFLVFEVPKHPSLGSFANLTSMDNIYRHIVPPIHLQIFSEKSLKILLGDRFDIISIWEFGQGFMDVINNAMILSGSPPCEMYGQIIEAGNKIQQSIDEAGLADQILIIAQRKE